MKVEIEIPNERIACLLFNAIDHGSAHWLRVEGYRVPAEEVECIKSMPRWITYALTGGMIRVRDNIQDDAYRIRASVIRKGLARMAEKYPHQFGRFLSRQDDGATSDLFMQCMLFGELRYGG